MNWLWGFFKRLEVGGDGCKIGVGRGEMWESLEGEGRKVVSLIGIVSEILNVSFFPFHNPIVRSAVLQPKPKSRCFFVSSDARNTSCVRGRKSSDHEKR